MFYPDMDGKKGGYRCFEGFDVGSISTTLKMRQITVYRTFTKFRMNDNVDDCHMNGRLRFSGTRKHENMSLFSENLFLKRRVCQAEKKLCGVWSTCCILRGATLSGMRSEVCRRMVCN